MFWSSANTLHFEGDVSGDPLPVVAALHNLVHKQGYEDIALDFKKATFLAPAFMVPLVSVCRSYRKENVDFDIMFPDDRKSAAILSNANWAYLISPEHYESRGENNQRHLSATQFFTPDDHHKAVDKSISLLLEVAAGMDRSRIKALEWALNEVSDNVLNHAESPIGGIMQVVSFPKKKRVELIVCDGGMSIPRSLRQGRPSIGDDSTALRQAIEEGVTKNVHTNQGNGLFGTFKCCEVSGGEFDIISGNVSLSHRPGQLKVSRNNIPFKGTLVRASINTDYEELLEKALIFRGRPHDPPFDYVDRRYQTESENVAFKVSEEIDAFGSREAGRRARNKIENLMDGKRAPIIFDFDGVRLISSSFADEVFGRLFENLGPIAFGRLCNFKNVDRTVQGLIDRAILQRLKV